MPESTAEPKDKTDVSKLSVAGPSKLKEKTDKSSMTESKREQKMVSHHV